MMNLATAINAEATIAKCAGQTLDLHDSDYASRFARNPELRTRKHVPIALALITQAESLPPGAAEAFLLNALQDAKADGSSWIAQELLSRAAGRAYRCTAEYAAGELARATVLDAEARVVAGSMFRHPRAAELMVRDLNHAAGVCRANAARFADVQQVAA